MANKRFYNSDGYGQIEINRCAFQVTRRIEAQCKLSSDFSTSLPLENGMIVAIDKMNGVIALAETTETRPFGVVYSAEKNYDERLPGLKNFKMTDNTGFYPRVGYLSVGDTFTTNCIAADSATYTNDAALSAALAAIPTTPMYGTYTTDLGAMAISTVAPTAGPIFKVIKKTTMPDGQTAIKVTVEG